MPTERLQKFLASAGVASRRKAEEMIANGRVKVNNAVVTELGTKVDPARDLVTLDGKPVHEREEERYYLLYKPSGCVTTMKDPQGRPTAAEYLSAVEDRVFPVGRLDYDAEGAVLFTTDGALANRLAHPRYGHRRVYLAKVKPPPGDEAVLLQALARMVAGLRLEDGPAKALEAEIHEEAEKNVWVRVVVGEGRHHLVKRLLEAVGLPVLRLFRPEFGGISVRGLRPGKWRALDADEVRTMRRAAGEEGMPGLEKLPPPPARRELPKAARRHGHGPPAPPSRRDAESAPASASSPAAKGKPVPAPRFPGAAPKRTTGGTARRPATGARRPAKGGGKGGSKGAAGGRRGPRSAGPRR